MGEDVRQIFWERRHPCLLASGNDRLTEASRHGCLRSQDGRRSQKVCLTLAMNTLNNKIALVTGGGRGIGEACAVALAEAGADVAVCSRSSGEIDAVAERIRAAGRRALAVVCDVTEADQVRRMAEEVNSQFGVVEILVNNAGLGRSARFVDHPDELGDRMWPLNLTSVNQLTKGFIPKRMERGQGRLINIASLWSKSGAKNVPAYAAAKNGV